MLRSLETDEELIPNNELQEIADHMNQQHRASKAVQLESMEWFAAMYFKNHEVVEEGVIYSMRANAFQVFIPAYHIKGTLWIVNKEGQVNIPEGEASRLQLTEQHLEKAEKIFDDEKLEMVQNVKYCYSPQIRPLSFPNLNNLNLKSLIIFQLLSKWKNQEHIVLNSNLN